MAPSSPTKSGILSKKPANTSSPANSNSITAFDHFPAIRELIQELLRLRLSANNPGADMYSLTHLSYQAIDQYLSFHQVPADSKGPFMQWLLHRVNETHHIMMDMGGPYAGVIHHQPQAFGYFPASRGGLNFPPYNGGGIPPPWRSQLPR